MVDAVRVRRVVVGALAWALFAFAWSVAAKGGARDAFAGTGVLLLSALVAAAVTLTWQEHNRAIYRRRGPRRSVRRAEQSWEQDRLGQRMDFGDGLAEASEVVVGSDAGVKTYRATT